MSADESYEHDEAADPSEGGRNAARNAMKAAAVAAAATAGAAAARRAIGGKNASGRGSNGRSAGDGGGRRIQRETVSSGAAAAWDAAREHLLPALQDASRAVGRYLGRDAPEILRDDLIPPLVSAFEEARTQAAGKARSDEKSQGGA